MEIKMERKRESLSTKYSLIYLFPKFPFFQTSFLTSVFTRFFAGACKEIWKMEKINNNTPVAYCHRCKVWTPLAWLPADQRGRRAETWFCCAACGGKSYQLRDLTEAQARAKNKAAR
jgi:Zn finger protein HypA/HybF involved in hydrogenase expression